jgi:hypothetical protein
VMMFHVGTGLQDSTRICGLEGRRFGDWDDFLCDTINFV